MAKPKKKPKNKFCKSIKEIHSGLEEPFRIYWYIAVFIFLTTYVIINRCVVANFTFFTEFDGMNLLFVIWVAMLLLPCLGSFEIAGFKFNKLGKKAGEIMTMSANPNVDIDNVKHEFDKMIGGDIDEE